MIAYRCDRCGEYYDDAPAARVDPLGAPIVTTIYDLCPGCWAIVRSTIGTPGDPPTHERNYPND